MDKYLKSTHEIFIYISFIYILYTSQNSDMELDIF